MFSLNQMVVYPGYGVARINTIIEKKVAGRSISFFELVFLHKEMTILVPMHNLTAVGVRHLSSGAYINDLLKDVSTAAPDITKHDITTTNWNKRNKEYQGRIQSGDLHEICKIYRDLRCIEHRKELSFGEKNLLQQTESLLVEEIALAKNIAEEKAIEYLREQMRFLPKKPHAQLM